MNAHASGNDRVGGTDLRTARLLASRMIAAGQGSVDRVVFYGSRARGTASPASDWDFVVVLRDGTGDLESHETLLRSAAVGSEGSGDAVSVDVWPIEKSEWERARNLRGHPIRTAEQEGVVLYGA